MNERDLVGRDANLRLRTPRRKRPTTLSLGTISEGTLKPEDLISALRWDLERIRMSHADRKRFRTLMAEVDAIPTDESGEMVDNEETDLAEIWEEMTRIADQYVPSCCYFGSIDGDGACIGVWPCTDVLEVFDGLTVSDTSDVPASYLGEVLHINERGNMTLYYARRGARLSEIWSVV